MQATNHPTHEHTLPPQLHQKPLTRSQHKRSLRSRDARQRRAQLRITNRATRRRNYRSWRSALTPTTSAEPFQGRGSLDRPHPKPLYDLTGRALSHRLQQQQQQQQRSDKQQRHTQTAPSAAATTRTHRCHRFRRFLHNLFKLKRKTPQNNSTPNHLRTDTRPRPAPQSRRQWQARHDTRRRWFKTHIVQTRQEGQIQTRPSNPSTAPPPRRFLENHRPAGSSQATHLDTHHA